MIKIKCRFLKAQLKDKIKAAKLAANRGNREICGLLVWNGFFIEILSVKNKSQKAFSASFYYNEIRALKKATRVLGNRIVGTFHSHPLGIGRPGADYLKNTSDASFLLIIEVLDKRERLWWIKDGKSRKLDFKLI